MGNGQGVVDTHGRLDTGIFSSRLMLGERKHKMSWTRGNGQRVMDNG